jgi:hypothetical protein
MPSSNRRSRCGYRPRDRDRRRNFRLQGPKENAIVTRYRYIAAALLVIGLASSAAAETQKDSKAGKAATPAPAAKSAKAKSPQTANTAKTGEGPAKETKQTPFGPVPVEATSEQPPPARDFSADPFVSAEEKGEMVIFRRKTPFGSQVWKKKKSELTADEQALLARGRPEPQKPLPAEAPAKDASAPAKDAPKPAPAGPK